MDHELTQSDWLVLLGIVACAVALRRAYVTEERRSDDHDERFAEFSEWSAPPRDVVDLRSYARATAEARRRRVSGIPPEIGRDVGDLSSHDNQPA